MAAVEFHLRAEADDGEILERMTGLFYDIRGFFNAKYSGRYIALMLRELGRREPEVFARIFSLDRAVAVDAATQFETEWPFPNREGKYRAADLAVLRGGKAILLVEVKEDDVLSHRNAAQLRDYLQQDARFAHVSRYSLPQSEVRAIEARPDARSVRYKHIFQHLRRANKPLSRIFADYLEDIGVTSYKAIDLKKQNSSLVFLLIQLLGFPHAHGLGRLQSDAAIDSVPEYLKVILGNVEALAEWARDGNRSRFKTRFTRKLKPVLNYDLRKVSRSLQDPPDEGGIPGDGKNIVNGSVYFYALGKFKTAPASNDWLYLEIGYKLTVRRDKKRRFDGRMYAEIHGKDLVPQASFGPTWTMFPSEKRAQGQLRRCVTSALDKAKKKGPSRYARILRTFEI